MSDLCPVAVADGNGMNEIQPKTASECFLQALKAMKLCDVVFTFENCDDRIEAHQLILRWRSPVFFAMFRGQGANVGKMREVQVTGIPPQRFQEFLEFMYADKFDANIAAALDLLHLGHKYKIDPLVEKCEELLKTEIQVEDAVEVFETARKYEISELAEKAGAMMAENLEQISQNDGLLNAQEDTLIYLLERDDFTVDEVDLFRIVVKWGENKHKRASETADLKTMLANLLPLVRFTNMTPNEFASEVVPLNLLPVQEAMVIYSYFASDKDKRQTMSALVNFSTKPRKSDMGSLFRFYKDTASGLTHHHVKCELKECLSFLPMYAVAPKLLHNYSSRRPAITGVLIYWPRRYCNASQGYIVDNPNFKASVKWYAEGITDQSVELKFQKVVSNCTVGQETEITVDPSVELITGATYCITVEGQSNHFWIGRSHCYSQNARGTLNQTVLVPLKKFSLKLKTVERNTDLSGFAEAAVKHINLIQGIRISLV